MPLFLIHGVQHATVPLEFVIEADDEVQALNQIYSGMVEPMKVGNPARYGDVRTHTTPKLIKKGNRNGADKS